MSFDLHFRPQKKKPQKTETPAVTMVCGFDVMLCVCGFVCVCVCARGCA